MKVDILEKDQVYNGFLKLEKVTLQHELYNGEMSRPIVREHFYRGDSVAVLIYDSANKCALFTKQFRYPVYSVEPDNGWFLELVAGSIGKGAIPRDIAYREVKGEIRMNIDNIELAFIGKYFLSPGGTSERIYIYAADMELKYAETYGGLKEENEDIKSVIIPYDDLRYMIKYDKICDAKTIIGLNWLFNRGEGNV